MATEKGMLFAKSVIFEGGISKIKVVREEDDKEIEGEFESANVTDDSITLTYRAIEEVVAEEMRIELVTGEDVKFDETVV